MSTEEIGKEKLSAAEQLARLTSHEKAAILIRRFSKETAKRVVENLGSEERQSLIREIARMKSHENDVVIGVMLEYMEYFKSRNLHMMSNGIEYVRELFSDMEDKELNKMLNAIYSDIDNPFEFINYKKDIDGLMAVLSNEDAQTIATVASHVEPKVAAELLQNLNDEKLVETVLSISKMDQYDNEILVKMGKMLENKLASMSIGDSTKTDGMKKVVGILNNVQRSKEKFVLEKLELIDSELAKKIKESLFTFDDLVALESVQLQKVLGEIQDLKELARAMKLAKEELKEKIISSMSKNRSERLLEELEFLGPVKVAEAEKAQQSIAEIAKRMELEGKIQLSRGAEDVIL